jgi:hypothetical protein
MVQELRKKLSASVNPFRNPQVYNEPITTYVGPGSNQPTRYGGVYNAPVTTYIGGAQPSQAAGSRGTGTYTTYHPSGGTTTNISGGTYGFIGGHFYGGHHDGIQGRQRR